MKIAKDLVEALVGEVSKRMSDPDYSAGMVGGFVEGQTPVTQFLTAHQSELGGPEAVISVVFHAALLIQCFERADRKVPEISFDDLDATSTSEPLKSLDKVQPSLSDLIVSNVEDEEARRLLAHIALAMNRAAV